MVAPPPPGSLRSTDGRALLVDYAGVLTARVSDGWRRFEQEHGVPARTVIAILWEAYEQGADDTAVARVERGDLDVGQFERLLAARLRAEGHDVEADGLVERLFADLGPSGGVWDVVHHVRRLGVPAVLVSNSWGVDRYPEDLLRATFDAIVLSGRVGMRKPERAIFEHAAGLVGADLPRCVLVDDAPATVAAAERHGMVGVLHRGDADATRAAVLRGLGAR